MNAEIGDGIEKFVEWLLAIPGSVPILLGAAPHNASLVRAIITLVLITLVVYVIARRPLRSIVRRAKTTDGVPDKPNEQQTRG